MTKASIMTMDGKMHRGTIPQTAWAGVGASMRRGLLPIAYFHHGDGTARTFYGITKEHAFQRALRFPRPRTV